MRNKEHHRWSGIVNTRLSLFMRPVVLAILAAALSPVLFSLDGETETEDKTVYYIRNVEVDVSGPTIFDRPLPMGYSRPFAVMYHGELKEGEEIQGTAGLEKYMRDKTQLIMNQRVIASAVIDYTVAEAEEDGRLPVDLLVTVRDSWNIIALPQPRYDSNEGMKLFVKARDYNFFGTMNPLRLDIGYTRNLSGIATFSLLVDTNTRFKALGLDWNLNFDNEFFYTMGEPLSYINTTGFDVEIPVKRTTLVFTLAHAVNLFARNAEDLWPVYGKYFEGVYNAMNFALAWQIPLGVGFGDYELTYTPSITESVPYAISPNWPLDPLHRGPITGFAHSFGVNKVDWIDNFRKGYNITLNNSYTLLPNTQNSIVANIQYDATAIGHFIINDSLGFSTRLRFAQWFNKFPLSYTLSTGDVLRGVPDMDVSADYMLSLNLDLPIRIVTFTPSTWISRKLRIFDFEVFLAPVLDMALVRDPISGRRFNPKDIYVSGGFELVIFPTFMRSLYLRISPCFDLIKFIDQSAVPFFGRDSNGARNIELFLGMEFSY
ncbi:MAG: hypothetical protein LBI86_12480 [Treponema sp.]|nr:hypothetical protein [Treponema sp.]